MKKILSLLIALLAILPIKAADLKDSDYRIIIPRHVWTEYMGYEKNSNGELVAKVPTGSLLDLFPDIDKAYYLQSAVIKDKIYVGMSSGDYLHYPNKTSQGYIFEQGAQKMWYGGNSLTTFPFESSGDWYYMGPAIAADDAGNLWVATRRTDTEVDINTLTFGWGHKIGSVAYYQPGGAYENDPTVNPNAIGKGVKFEYQKNGQTYNATITERTDIMSAYGDGVNGTGHLWFTPEKQCFVECIILKNGAVTDKKAFMLPDGEFNSHRGYINQFAPNKVLYHTGGQNTIGKIYYGTLDGATVETSTKITWEDTGLNYCRNGATAFILHGHEVIAYSDIPGGNEVYYAQNKKSAKSTNDTKAKEIITPTATPKAYLNNVIPAAYAYDLKSSKSGNNYILSFKSNATASSATIKVIDKNSGVSNTYNVGAVKQGDNSITIDANTLIKGNYTWSVSIANAATTLQKYHDQGGTNNDKRGGVAIDFDSESPYYGYIYTTIAKTGGGIQRYNPDLTPIGGIIHSDKFDGDKLSSPYRIKTNSGKLYIADYGDGNSSGVWVYNPVSGSFTQMFQGTRATSGQWTNSNGVVIGGSMTGIDFYGEGANRKMLAQCEDYYNTGTKWELLRYDLGTADSWNKAPSKTYPSLTTKLSKHNVEITTCEKGAWLCQNSYNNYDNEASPSFMFIDFDGNIKFNSASLTGDGAIDYAFESGIAINKDMTKLAVAGGGGNINFCNVKIYDVEWPNNGNTPKLTYAYEINLGHSNKGDGAVEQIVFDPAGNLLIWSRQKGLMAFTLKDGARQTVTDAPSTASFTIEGLPTGTSSSTISIPGIKEVGANRITLYDWTTKTKIGSFTPYDNVADQSFLSHSINVMKVADGQQIETDFFNYAPGEGGMKSIARAIVIDNPVLNLTVDHYCHKKSDEVSVEEGHRKVKLSWTAQTYDRDIFNKYEIRYRTKKFDANNTIVTDWTVADIVGIDYSDGKYDVDRGASYIYELTYGGADTPNDPSDDYDLAYEFSVIPVYTYDTNDRGENNTEYTVEKVTPVIPSAAPRSPIDVNLFQVTEGEGVAKKYSFDLKLEVASNSNLEIPYLIGGGKASMSSYVVEVTGDNVNEIVSALEAGELVCLDANGNNITATAITKSPNGLTISSNNCDHYDISNYCIVVNAPSAISTASAKLPTLVWKNVDPQLKYELNVYGISNYECNFVAAATDEEMVIPVPTWSLTDLGFYKLAGDYSALATAENQPLGSHRLINDDGVHVLSNQVAINNANYYGTNGGAISPIRVTDNVLGVKDANGHYINNDWIINYDFVVTDYLGNKVRSGHFYEQSSEEYPEYAECYSNEKNVTCDIVGLPVEFTTEIGEDGRTRNIYTPSQGEYKATLTTTYVRKSDKLEIKKTSESTAKAYGHQLEALGVSTSNDGIRGALFIPKVSTNQTESHFWWNESSEGYYSRYFDALLLFDWENKSNLNRYLGYYAKTKDVCYGHYENASSSTWTRYASASVLTDSQIDEYISKVPDLEGGAINYDGSNNWSALAIEKEQLPMKVHYVHGDNGKNTSLQNTDVKFDVTLTAEYPVVITSGELGTYACEDPSAYIIADYNPYMVTLTVPTTLSNVYASNTNITTGVEGIITEACGGWNIYPNPVENAFTLKAPMAINEVKIFTSTGQLVKEVNDCNDTSVVIAVDNLPQGVYIVKAFGEAKIMIKQ